MCLHACRRCASACSAWAVMTEYGFTRVRNDAVLPCFTVPTGRCANTSARCTGETGVHFEGVCRKRSLQVSLCRSALRHESQLRMHATQRAGLPPMYQFKSNLAQIVIIAVVSSAMQVELSTALLQTPQAEAAQACGSTKSTLLQTKHLQRSHPRQTADGQREGRAGSPNAASSSLHDACAACSRPRLQHASQRKQQNFKCYHTISGRDMSHLWYCSHSRRSPAGSSLMSKQIATVLGQSSSNGDTKVR